MSLKYRIALTIFILEAIMVSVVLWYTLSYSLSSIREQFSYSDRAALHYLSELSLTPLVTEDYGGAQAIFEQVSDDARIETVHLVDRSSRIVVSTDFSRVGAPLPDLTDADDRYWKSRAVSGASGELGLVAVEFSNTALTAAVREARNLGIAIASAGMLFIAGVGVAMGHLLTRRLAQLSLAAQRLAAGDSDVQVALPGRDEVARAAEAFDAMTRTISKTLHDLRQSEARIRAVMENISDGVVTIDRAGRVESINPAAERTFGHAANEVVGKNVTMLMAEPDRSRHDGYIRTYLDTGKGKFLGVGPREVTGRRKDGSTVPLELVVTEMLMGEKRMFIGAMRDISERKRAEEQMWRSEKRFSDAIEASPSLIGIVRVADGKFVYVNESWVSTMGYARDEAIGRSAVDLGLWQDPDDRARLAGRLRDRGRIRDEEQTLRTKSGDIREFLTSIQTIDFEGDAHLLFMAHDVTERKALEEQLRHAQKMEAVGQLTGGLAHDFNNLLAVIIGNLELLDERLEGDGELRGFGRQAIASAERGADLTRRLLAFSRKQTLLPGVIDLNGLLTGMLDLLHRTLGEVVEIETVLAGRLWPTFVDASQLENALLNLAVNARDAMPEGGKLTLETANARLDEDYAAAHEEVRAGQYVMLAVSDTGAGMSPEVMERAIEPFFTTKETGEGSGLGLSMVYGFVKQSGGHVKVYSEVGHGTTVKIYLPRSRAEPDAEAVALVGLARPSKGEAILVVEDADDVRSLDVMLLTKLGYRPVEARDGKSALAVLERTPEVTLLFTDVVLPGGMSGPEFAREAQRRRPELKVLFTSGYTENSIVHHCRLDDSVELIEKPYRWADLARRLRAILGREED